MFRTASIKKGDKGFTLIELLIVIGIIGILAAIILVAVDPAKRLKQSRNARRFAETNAILNAILNYTVDYKGTLPSAVLSATTGQAVIIGTGNIFTPRSETLCPASATGSNAATNTTDLAGDAALVSAYIAEIPVDPRAFNDNGDLYDSTVTGYYLIRSANGRLEVGSCNPESEDNITTPTIKIKR